MVFVSPMRVVVVAAALMLVLTSAPVWAQALDQPMTRMRPIGAPSAVDKYRPRTVPAQTQMRQVNFQSPVRQTVMLQGEISSPPLPTYPAAPITLPANPSAVPVPSGQPGVPASGMLPAGSVVSGSDVQPMPQPQLGSRFATIDNCNLVSPASGYSAAFGYGCGNEIAPQSYTATQPCPTPLAFTTPPAEIAAPAVMPPNAQLGAPMRSLITLGQERNPVQVGQGIIGQPVAYVPGQPLRNWLRYLFP